MENRISIHFHTALGYYLNRNITISLLHGPAHWIAVYDNCLRLDLNCNDTIREHYAMFAFFHDAGRTHDGFDVKHGKEIVHNFSFPDDVAAAIAIHADGLISNIPFIGVCWDADRLDLPRVGIKVNPELLNTEAAKLLCQNL